MKLEALHAGMRVRHPQYGSGTVKTIGEQTADIRFDTGDTRTMAPEPGGLEPLDAQLSVSGLSRPLEGFVRDTVRSVLAELGLGPPDEPVPELAARWHKGRLVLHPANAALQAKEVPVEVFFHKIVMMRNNLRLLEQKINAHPALNDSEKVEMQQYVTRCYGSMTTFNILFHEKEDQFSGAAD
ncbi:MAG: hypothetical protein JXQ71_09900 [Verrucomicrobia bacterium]|nr:hypothetical protein [Verrucomicrobiota bacterium]